MLARITVHWLALLHAWVEIGANHWSALLPRRFSRLDPVGIRCASKFSAFFTLYFDVYLQINLLIFEIDLIIFDTFLPFFRQLASSCLKKWWFLINKIINAFFDILRNNTNTAIILILGTYYYIVRSNYIYIDSVSSVSANTVNARDARSYIASALEI